MAEHDAPRPGHEPGRGALLCVLTARAAPRCQTRATMATAPIHIGMLVIGPGVLNKLNQKHGITEDEVRGYLQWPATPRVAPEVDEDGNERWIGLILVGKNRPPLFAADYLCRAPLFLATTVWP